MKAPRVPMAPGSFEKPPQMKAMLEREEQKRKSSEPKEEAKQEPRDHGDLPGLKNFDDGWDDPVRKQEAKKAVEQEDPAHTLRPKGILGDLEKQGIKLTEDQLALYLYKGFVEADADIFKISEKDTFKVKIRTLSSFHCRLVDEIVAENLSKQDMTREGVASLRTVVVLSLGVTHINGAALPIMDAKSKSEVKEKALENMNEIEDLAPAVANKINSLHSSLTTALNLIISSGNSPFLTDS